MSMVDFSILGDLGKTYKDARLQSNRERTLAELGRAGPDADYNELARQALAGGDTQTAMTLANIGNNKRDFAHRERMASPEYIRTVAETQAKVAAEYAPKTLDIKPHGGGDPYTVEKGPNGYTIPTVSGVPQAPAIAITGDDFLKTLPAGRANQIKAIADGRMSPPGGMSLKSPQIQSLMRDVAQYEPGFDLTSWTARNKTRADLGSGKMGQNVTAFNTAIGHLDTLDRAASALNNSWSPAYNTVANYVIGQKGDPRVNEFAVAKTAVADELTRAFRGTGGNVHDLIQWEKAINAAGSPEQLRGAVKQAVELLRSRIEAVGEQYSRGMGKTTDAMSLLSPKAQETLKKLSGETRVDPAAPGAATPDAPKPQTGITKEKVVAARADQQATLAEAKALIAQHPDKKAAIIRRLQQAGINPAGL